MNDDKGWKLILFLGAVLLGAILYNHVKRDKPPHAAMKNVSPDGAEFVTPLLTEKTPEEPELPSRVSEEYAKESLAAWQAGTYEVIPSEPELLVLENGYERKAFLMSQATLGGCTFSRGKTCLLGPDLETIITDQLPARLRVKGSTPDQLRKAPATIPEKPPTPQNVKPVKAATAPTAAPKPAAPTVPASTGAVSPAATPQSPASTPAPAATGPAATGSAAPETNSESE